MSGSYIEGTASADAEVIRANPNHDAIEALLRIRAHLVAGEFATAFVALDTVIDKLRFPPPR